MLTIIYFLNIIETIYDYNSIQTMFIVFFMNLYLLTADFDKFLGGLQVKKRISIIIALVLIASMLIAACGGDSGGTTTPTETPTTDGGTTTETPATGGDDEGETPADDSFGGYPMDAQDVTVSFWLWGGPQLHASIANWQDSPFHSGLNEQVGVNIDWMFPPAGASDELQEFNLILASGNYPDIMFSGNIMREAERLIDERVLRDLSDYIQSYAPNYYQFLQENPFRDRAFKTDSGKYFGFGFFREADGWNDTYQGPLIRQDWLDELNLPTPVTISDWDTTLRAFNEAYGATFSAPWSRFDESGNIAGAFGAWGGTRMRIFVDRNDGQVKIAQLMPGWDRYAEQMAEWWSDGLIDQDLISNVDAEVRAKALNNEIGMAYSSMGQLSGWINDSVAEDTGSNWVGFDYPRGDDGTKTFVFGGPGIGGTSASITTNVENERLEVVMRVLDFAYSHQGFMYWNFGTEGVSYNIEGGRPIFSELLHNDPDGIHGAMEKFVGSVWNGPTIQATEVLVQRNQPASIDANNTWFFGNESIAQDFPLPRGMALSASEVNIADLYEGALKTYIDENAVSFITGTNSIDFATFVANAEAMGVSELLAQYQAAYERWLAR